MYVRTTYTNENENIELYSQIKSVIYLISFLHRVEY